MSIETKINTELNTIIRSVVGELTLDDVTQAFTDSLSRPDFKENMHVIWDITEGDLKKLSANHLITIVEHIRNNINSRGATYKISIVAPEDFNFGISRMFEAYGNDLPVSINIHRNINEAFDWIIS